MNVHSLYKISLSEEVDIKLAKILQREIAPVSFFFSFLPTPRKRARLIISKPYDLSSLVELTIYHREHSE